MTLVIDKVKVTSMYVDETGVHVECRVLESHQEPPPPTRWMRFVRSFRWRCPRSNTGVIREGGYQPTRDPGPVPESLIRRKPPP